MLKIKKIKAFTMIELLITMTLTAILVVFAFLGYSQIEKLFIDYSRQNKFIVDYNQINKALNTFSQKYDLVQLNNNQNICFKNDSTAVALELRPNNILLKFESHTDTFNLKIQNPKFVYIKSNNDSSINLIKDFECECLYQNQKFDISFHKEYDALSVLKSTLQRFPPDEQY